MNETLDLDLVAGAVRQAMALILVVGAAHKLRLGAAFGGIVAAYRLLPQPLLAPATWLLPRLELAAAAALLWPGLALLSVAPALMLLLPMTLAVAINLARGRSEIDCGCGGTRGQGLSNGLVVRNIVLMLSLLCAARPLHLAALGVGGIALMSALGLALSSLYFSSSQLLANARQWRVLVGADRA